LTIAAIRTAAHEQTLTLACLIAAGVGLVLQNTLMVRITQSASTS
jgi:transporter family-2 protein